MTEAGRDQMERVVIGRRETCELEYQVDQPHTVLRWEFVTVDHSISFGWYLKGARRKLMNALNVVSTWIITRTVATMSCSYFFPQYFLPLFKIS